MHIRIKFRTTKVASMHYVLKVWEVHTLEPQIWWIRVNWKVCCCTCTSTCTNIENILHKYCTNIAEILDKYWTYIGQILDKKLKSGAKWVEKYAAALCWTLDLGHINVNYCTAPPIWTMLAIYWKRNSQNSKYIEIFGHCNILKILNSILNIPGSLQPTAAGS